MPAGPEPTTATSSVVTDATPPFSSSRVLSWSLLPRALSPGVFRQHRVQLRHGLGDLPGQVLRDQPDLLEDLVPRPVRQEPLRQAEGPGRSGHPGVPEKPAHGVAEPAGDAV